MMAHGIVSWRGKNILDQTFNITCGRVIVIEIELHAGFVREEIGSNILQIYLHNNDINVSGDCKHNITDITRF